MPRQAGIGIALQVGDDLGAEQQDESDGLESEQDDDDGGHRSVDDVDHGNLGIINDEQVPHDFPEDGGGNATGEGAAERDLGHGHDDIKKRKQEHESEHPDPVDDATYVVFHERADEWQISTEAFLGIDESIDRRNEDEASGDDKDEEVRHEGRDPELAFQGGQGAMKDDGDGIFEDAKGHGAEKKQHQSPHPADHLTVPQKPFEHLRKSGREAGRDQRDLGRERIHDQLLRKKMGEDHHQHRRKWNQRKHHAVRDRARQQQPVVAQEKVSQHPGGELYRFGQAHHHQPTVWRRKGHRSKPICREPPAARLIGAEWP